MVARVRDLGVISIKIVFEIWAWMRYMIYGESVVGEKKRFRFSWGWGVSGSRAVTLKCLEESGYSAGPCNMG